MSVDWSRLREHPECPSDFELDLLYASELEGDDRARVQEHCARCEICEARLAERRAGFDVIAEVEPRRLRAAIRRSLAEPTPEPSLWGWMKRGRRLWTPGVALAAGVAAAWLMTTLPPPAAPLNAPMVPEVRAKGGLALHLHRKTGMSSEILIDGAEARPGDTLRFMVDLPRPGRVRIIGVEASGIVYTAWPLEPSMTDRRATGEQQALPDAVILDEAPGRESFYLVLCPDPGPAPICAATTEGLSCPASCEVTAAFSIVKP